MTTVLEDLYPSRVGGVCELHERTDPVVYTKGPPARGLTADQAKQFDRDGFLVLEGLLSDEEVEALETEVQRLATSKAVLESESAITEPTSGALRSLFYVHMVSKVLDLLSRDRRLLDVATHILGGEVYIHQSRINLKPGFAGKEFYWHSDFETWHVEDGLPRMRTLSASVLLTDNYPFNGPLMLIPGAHRTFVACPGETPADNYKTSLKRQDLGVPDDATLTRLVEEHGIAAPIPKAGSVLFFDSNAMHGSNGNITPYPRHNVFFVYNSVENTPQDPFSGLPPRPDFIANRSDFTPLAPETPDYPSLVIS